MKYFMAGLIGLMVVVGCSTLTQQRVDKLTGIAGEAATVGTQDWLEANPNHRRAFELAMGSLMNLWANGETNLVLYVNQFQSLPLETWKGKSGELYVTASNLVVWDQHKATVADGELARPVMKAAIAGVKRGMTPRPPLPGFLRYQR